MHSEERLDPVPRRIRTAGIRFKSRILDKRSILPTYLLKLQYYGKSVWYRYLGDVIRVVRYWPVWKLLSVRWSGVVGVADIHHARVSACRLRQPNSLQSSTVSRFTKRTYCEDLSEPVLRIAIRIRMVWGLLDPYPDQQYEVRVRIPDPSIIKKK